LGAGLRLKLDPGRFAQILCPLGAGLRPCLFREPEQASLSLKNRVKGLCPLGAGENLPKTNSINAGGW